jgi:acetyl esterase/lipase
MSNDAVPLRRYPPLPLTPIIADRLAELLAVWPRELTLENLADTRATDEQLYPQTIDEHVGTRPLDFFESEIASADGAPIRLACYRPSASSVATPAFLYLHSGGLVTGTRFAEDLRLLDLAVDTGSSVVSVEYRLAPEHSFPAAIEDCYAAWNWLASGRSALNVDPSRIVLVGESAGGGLAAALAILIRDRGGAQPAAQLLATPMLDHRNNSASVHQLDGIGLWDKVSNQTGWSAYLGPSAGTDNVPGHGSPSSAEVLASLPPAFIDVGDAEIFRDEAVDYARRLWLAGVSAELHVWTGGCHTFYALIPELPLAQVVYASRLEWLLRTLYGTVREGQSKQHPQ